jgi:hypothetical protein
MKIPKQRHPHAVAGGIGMPPYGEIRLFSEEYAHGLKLAFSVEK